MANDRIWILLSRKLSGEATLTELEELESLISQSPEAASQVFPVADWWQRESINNSDFLEATYLVHLERMKTKGFHLNENGSSLQSLPTEAEEPAGKNSIFSKKFVPWVVGAMLLAGSWLLIDQVQAPPNILPAAKPAEVLTRNGARTRILLPDGTNVWLNSGSKITYDKNFQSAATREVTLTGEAFFDVVKVTGKSFVIHTSKIDIKVLGTRFNVKAYSEDKTTETSLIKGSVEIYLRNNPAKKYLLEPSQKLILLNEVPANNNKIGATKKSTQAAEDVEIRPLTYIEGTDSDVESSWTKNILSFEDESFAEVAKKMERWYDVTIEFKGKRWQQKFLNGSFEKETIEQAMDALQFSTGFKYSVEGQKIIIF